MNRVAMILIISVTTSLVSGCVPLILIKDGATQKDFDRDYNLCYMEAMQFANNAGSPGNPLFTIPQTRKCMISEKGWNVKKS